MSGYIGRTVMKHLAGNDTVAGIVGLDANPPEGKLPDKVVFVRRDIREPLADLFAEHEIDTVIHAAYILTPIRSAAETEDINKAGTENVLQACRKTGVKHLLYTSSATAYGFFPDNPVPMAEEHPLRGHRSFLYARNKMEIEARLEGFIEHNPAIAVTILRPCFVVGPGFSNPVSRFFLRSTWTLPREDPPFQFVHEDDVARAIVHCLENSIAGVFNIAGDGMMSLHEAAEMLNRKVVRIPFWVLSLINQIAWWLRITAVAESPSNALDELRYPWVVATDRFIRETGFQYRYSSREAFAEFVRTVESA